MTDKLFFNHYMKKLIQSHSVIGKGFVVLYDGFDIVYTKGRKPDASSIDNIVSIEAGFRQNRLRTGVEVAEAREAAG